MALKTFSKDIDIDTYGGGLGTLRLTVTEDNTDITNNLSNCSYTLQLIISSGNTWRASSGSWGLSGNVSNSGSIASMTYYSGTTTLASDSFQVSHGGDGTASFSINFSFTSSYRLGGSGTLSGTLTTIPRQANITSASNFNDESNPTIKYSNPAGNSVNSLQACIANANGTVIYVPYRDIPKTSTSYTFNLTETERNTLRNAIPNDPKLKVKFYVKTVIGSSTYYSSLSTNNEMTIINGNPTFNTFEYSTNLSELTGNTDTIINNKTTTTFTIDSNNKAVANKGATLLRYSFVCGDKSVLANYSDNTITASLMNCNSDIIKVTAIDSRGFEKTVTKTVTNFKNYYSPNIVSTSVEREDGIESTVYLDALFNFWNYNFGNTNNKIETLYYRTKQSSSMTYSNWFEINTSSLVINKETATLNDIRIYLDGISQGFTVGTSYDIQLKIGDEIDTVESGEIDLYDGKVAFSILKDANGDYHIGINGMPDLDYAMKVHGTISNE